MKKDQDLEIPDEAIKYIIDRFLKKKQVAGISISVGISQIDVESVLDLFFRWAKSTGHLKDDILSLDKFKEL